MRGYHSLAKRHYLKELLVKECIDIVCFQETNIDSFSKHFFYIYFYYFQLLIFYTIGKDY
jgi:hypothetical protein